MSATEQLVSYHTSRRRGAGHLPCGPGARSSLLISTVSIIFIAFGVVYLISAPGRHTVPDLFGTLRFRKKEIPVDPQDEPKAGQADQNFRRHHPPSPDASFARRSRSELDTTETELKAMAREAMIGLSRMPKKG